MVESNGGYSLRHGNSPYRNGNLAPPSYKKKKKVISEDQEICDSINVTTYNDNPKNLYGLDKIDGDEPPPVNIFKFNPFFGGRIKRKKDTSQSRSSLMDWFGITLYILFVLLLYEGASKFVYQKTVSENTQETETNSQIVQRLLDQIHLQKKYLDQVSENIVGFKQNQIYSNCTCDVEVDTLVSKENAQKLIMEKLQQQILSTIDVVKAMNDKVSVIKKEQEQQQAKKSELKKDASIELCNGKDCRSSSPNVYNTIQSALDSYHADILALTDFALESAGGAINSPYHTETCEVGAPIIKVFGLPLWQDPRSPRSVIQSDTSAGNCWPMKSSMGYIVVKLAVPIEVTMFTLEHLDRKLDRYSNNMYQLAPREFEVYAWFDKDGNTKIKLGEYVYLREHSPLQTFKAQTKVSKPINFVELRVLNNYGNPDCTCLYRFRVHGISSEWDNLDNEGRTNVASNSILQTCTYEEDTIM